MQPSQDSPIGQSFRQRAHRRRGSLLRPIVRDGLDTRIDGPLALGAGHSSPSSFRRSCSASPRRTAGASAVVALPRQSRHVGSSTGVPLLHRSHFVISHLPLACIHQSPGFFHFSACSTRRRFTFTGWSTTRLRASGSWAPPPPPCWWDAGTPFFWDVPRLKTWQGPHSPSCASQVVAAMSHRQPRQASVSTCSCFRWDRAAVGGVAPGVAVPAAAPRAVPVGSEPCLSSLLQKSVIGRVFFAGSRRRGTVSGRDVASEGWR